MSEESFVYTACPGWGDHDYCALKTIVKDGQIERMERIVYSAPEEPDGHICQKGCLAGRQPYDPNRLSKPLKRVGERGSGKFEEISWDQALDEIGEKLCRIRDEHGPDSVVLWNLGAGVPAQYSFENLMPFRFANTFGVTVPLGSIGLDNGPFYAEFYNAGSEFPRTVIDPRIMVGTDLIYVWGCNPIENQMRCAQNLVRAREAGARIVDLGLIFDGTAGFADEFVAMKPASDGYLAMAMVNYILQNDLQASDYLLARTIAAYLVDDETGQLARDAEGNFLVWDAAAGAAASVAPKRGAYPEGADIPLFGTYEIDGRSYATALQKLKDGAAEYTFELAAEKCGISAADAERLARDWVEAENAFILSGYGLRYRNSNETYRQFLLLGALTGRLGKPGSGVFEALQLQSWPLVFNDIPISCPDGVAGVKSVPVRMAEWFARAEADDSPYKALIVCSGNPVHQQPDRQRWLDVIRDMELVVDYDVWLTDTGEIADYVLPDLMSFEREDLITGACYNHIILQEPAIEPPAGCHDPVYLYTELARRCGLGEFFDKTGPEWIQKRLETPFPLVAGIQPPVTYERLKAEKMIRTVAPPEPKYDGYLNPAEVMENATGRIELYAERLLDHGLAVTHPLPVGCVGTHEEYPFQLFTGRQRFFMQSSFTDDPINVKMSGGTPATRLNPIDARQLGLHDGDMVEVYNDKGHVVTRLDIDECVPAGTVHVWFGWRRRQFEEGTYAEMVHECPNMQSTGPVQNKWWADWIEHGHHPNPFVEFMAALVGSTDCYWDSYCNIRRYDAAKEA